MAEDKLTASPGTIHHFNPLVSRSKPVTQQQGKDITYFSPTYDDWKRPPKPRRRRKVITDFFGPYENEERQQVSQQQSKEIDDLLDTDGDKERDESITDASPPKVEPLKHNKPYIIYRNRYRDPELLLVFESTSDQPLSAEEHQLGEDGQPAFEIVHDYTSASLDYVGMNLPPPVTGEGRQSITIRSAHILKALREIVQYYPQADISQATYNISAPYRLLVHHYEELKHYRDTINLNDAKEELTALINFLDKEVMIDVAAERERNARGLVTFDMLWYLYKPDSHVALSNSEPESKGGVLNRDAAVIATLHGGLRAGQRRAYEVGCWYLHYDGSVVTRVGYGVTVQPFAGELAIDRLEAAPLDLMHDLAEKLRDQGKIWYKLLQKPQCKQHCGAFLEFPFTVSHDHVMVDVVASREKTNSNKYRDSSSQRWDEDRHPVRYGREDKYDEYISDEDLDKNVPRRKRHSDRKTTEAWEAATLPTSRFYNDYDDINPDLVEELSERQYMLCPQKIDVWHFKTREWVVAAVSNLKDPVFDAKIMDRIVLDEQRRTLLQALAHGFMIQEDGSSPDPQWAADFIRGKGASQIFLLHGPPGVGKTFTAECMSEYTRRPLMTLSSSDIGSNSHEIEQRLDRNFKLAKKWGTILLIDEADVFLEDRKTTDLQRNGLVAAFLRALEMLEGILFLTTNRVGTFDDAFMSRIHVTMYYPPLTENDRRKIWENFFEKLRRERTDLRIMPEVEDFIDRSKMKKLELNGREIRNIFQTTVSLAQFSPDKDDNGKIMIKKGHIEQVANMSGEFKKYLVKVWNQSEGERARGRLLRLDDFGGEKKSGKKQVDSDSESD